MSDKQEQTRLPPEEHAVLLIGCSRAADACCSRAAAKLHLVVYRAALADAASAAASCRPLVLLVPQPVYDFDPSEFDDLARDVGAVVLKVADPPTSASEVKNGLVASVAVV